MKGKLSVVPWLLLLVLLCVSPARAATIAWATLRAGACSAVAVTPSPSPGNPSVLFASFAGDNVSGPSTLRSEDGGASWTAVLPVRAWSLATTPLAPEKVFAATDNGLFASADYGSSWTLLAPGARGFVAVNSGNDNILYLDNYRSLDSGLTWSPMTGLPPSAIGKNFHLKTTAGDPDFLLALSGYRYAYVSRDGGTTWSSQSGQRGDFYSVGMDPVDARYYYIGYCNYVQRWNPAGTSMPVASGDLLSIAADPGEHQKVFISGQGGVFYYSGDYGYSWAACTGTSEITHYGRMIVDGDEGILYLPTLSGLRAMSTALLPVTAPKISSDLVVGIDNGTSFQPRINFMPGQTVVFRSRAVELGSGLPVGGTSFVVRVAGPSQDNVVSETGDANGYAFARWPVLDPTTAIYSATLASVLPPTGFLWTGTQPVRTFTVGPAVRPVSMQLGIRQGNTFTPSTAFTAGDRALARVLVVDPNTGLPVNGARVDLSVVQSFKYAIGSATSGADGWAELDWVTQNVSEYNHLTVDAVVPPPGYVWDGVIVPQILFSISTPPVRIGDVSSVTTGKYLTTRKVTTYVQAASFTKGETVVLRVAVVDGATGLPVDGATASIGISGPSSATVISGASSGGVAEASWKTTAAGRKFVGTPAGIYLATVENLKLPTGYVWDGIVVSTTFELN